MLASSPSSHVRTAKIIGIESLRHMIQGVDFMATQLAPGPCTGDVLHADLDGVQFSSTSFDVHVRLRSLAPVASVTLGTVLTSEGAVSHWSSEIEPGDICICPVGENQEGHFRGRNACATIALPLETLMKAASAFDELGRSGLWSRTHCYRPSEEKRRELGRKLVACIEILRALGPDLSARGRKLMGEEILDAYLDALADAVLLGPPLEAVAASARTVKLVEDYVRDRHPAHIRVGSLCDELNISRRTLHRAFRETLGVGPKAYLRLASLSTARRVLVEAPPGTTSVTEVALDHGFLELGRFSVLYRQMFGESPSDTLRR